MERQTVARCQYRTGQTARLTLAQKLLHLWVQREGAVAGLGFQLVAAYHAAAPGFIMDALGIMPYMQQLFLPVDVLPAKTADFADAHAVQECEQYGKMQVGSFQFLQQLLLFCGRVRTRNIAFYARQLHTTDWIAAIESAAASGGKCGLQ